MNFNDIHYFIEVAKQENLTSAAERIGISQPSLSISMKRLEQELGVKLFNRFKTGVKLTPGGKFLLKNAHQLIDFWSAVKKSTHDVETEIAGIVTIGCHVSVANYHIPDAFFSLLKSHPNLNIRFTHGLSREINEAILNLRADLGIVVNPNYHPDLIIKKIHQDKVGFWHQIPLEQIDLKNITLICDPNLKQTQNLIKRLKQQGGQISRMIETENFEVLAKLARERIGISILPETVVNSKLNTGLKPLMPELFYSDDICLVYRHENRNVASIAAIVKCLAYRAQNQGDEA